MFELRYWNSVLFRMDDKIKKLIEKEEQTKVKSYDLMEKYKRVLRRSLREIECDGKEGIVYSNEEMIDKVENELEENVKIVKKLDKELIRHNENCLKLLRKDKVLKIQKEVEIVNQEIRILEATLGYIRSK